MHAVMSPDAYVPAMVGSDPWLAIVPLSELQANCNREGLNVTKTGNANGDFHRVRVGIIANGEQNCDTPESRLGLGGDGTELLPSGGPSVGNANGHNNMNNQVEIAGYGAILVR